MTTAEGEEWIVVGGKGKPRRNRKHGTPSGAASAAPGHAHFAGASHGGHAAPLALPLAVPRDLDGSGHGAKAPTGDGDRMARFVARLDQHKREVLGSAAWASVQQAAAAAASQRPQPSTCWCDVSQMVVYGLGPVGESKSSQYQLAMAVLLQQQLLPGLTRPMQLYDPAFTPWDVAALSHLGLQVIDRDEGGARAVDEPTFFYLPHCEEGLCEALLAANWSHERLPLLTILGNSFGSYHERWGAPRSGRRRALRPRRLLALVDTGTVLEVPTPDHRFPVASAFNDMSLHVFGDGALPPIAPAPQSQPV